MAVILRLVFSVLSSPGYGKASMSSDTANIVAEAAWYIWARVICTPSMQGPSLAAKEVCGRVHTPMSEIEIDEKHEQYQ